MPSKSEVAEEIWDRHYDFEHEQLREWKDEGRISEEECWKRQGEIRDRYEKHWRDIYDTLKGQHLGGKSSPNHGRKRLTAKERRKEYGVLGFPEDHWTHSLAWVVIAIFVIWGIYYLFAG